jgi:hypothetical protein
MKYVFVSIMESVVFEAPASETPFYYRPRADASNVAAPPLRTETYCTADKSKEVTLTLTKVFLSYVVKALVGQCSVQLDGLFFLFVY